MEKKMIFSALVNFLLISLVTLTLTMIKSTLKVSPSFVSATQYEQNSVDERTETLVSRTAAGSTSRVVRKSRQKLRQQMLKKSQSCF